MSSVAPQYKLCHPQSVLRWVEMGWRDFRAATRQSLAYGGCVFLGGWGLIALFFPTGLGWMLLPALAGMMLLGPLLATGLYNISRNLGGVINPHVAAPGQIFLVGVILMVLLLIWLRAAVILYALFFGLQPFAGFWQSMENLFFSLPGLGLVVVGCLVGGVFAALVFAISALSLPMLVEQEIDAFTAMGRSFSALANQPLLSISWGAVVVFLTLVGFLTGLVAMIVIFPVLGFASWHGYQEIFPPNQAKSN